MWILINWGIDIQSISTTLSVLYKWYALLKNLIGTQFPFILSEWKLLLNCTSFRVEQEMSEQLTWASEDLWSGYFMEIWGHDSHLVKERSQLCPVISVSAAIIKHWIPIKISQHLVQRQTFLTDCTQPDPAQFTSLDLRNMLIHIVIDIALGTWCLIYCVQLDIFWALNCF